MSSSLEEAAAENAAWEKQKATIDTKWATRIFGDPQPPPPAPPPSFEEQSAQFMRTHGPALRDYTKSLAKEAYNSGNEFTRNRASHLELLIDLMASNSQKIFSSREHEKAFISILKDGANPVMTGYSSEYAHRLREAVAAIEKLSQAHTANYGPML